MLCEIAYGLEACLTVGRRKDQGIFSIFSFTAKKKKYYSQCHSSQKIKNIFDSKINNKIEHFPF